MTNFVPNEENAYPEVLIDIAELVAKRLQTHVVNELEAKKIGYDVAEDIRHRHAGELVYFPRGRSFEANKVHEEIWDKFTGDNIPELAKEFKMAEASIYRILKLMKDRAMRRSQMSFLEGN